MIFWHVGYVIWLIGTLYAWHSANQNVPDEALQFWRIFIRIILCALWPFVLVGWWLIRFIERLA